MDCWRAAYGKLLEQVGAVFGGDGELGARLAAVTPALQALLQEREPHGVERLRRNVALHARGRASRAPPGLS